MTNACDREEHREATLQPKAQGFSERRGTHTLYRRSLGRGRCDSFILGILARWFSVRRLWCGLICSCFCGGFVVRLRFWSIGNPGRRRCFLGIVCGRDSLGRQCGMAGCLTWGRTILGTRGMFVVRFRFRGILLGCCMRLLRWGCRIRHGLGWCKRSDRLRHYFQ
jgi:hypothetical protein